MRILTEDERRQAEKAGLSESQALVALGLGMSLEAYAAWQEKPESRVDQVNQQAHMLEEIARRADPGARERIQKMVPEAAGLVDKLRQNLGLPDGSGSGSG